MKGSKYNVPLFKVASRLGPRRGKKPRGLRPVSLRNIKLKKVYSELRKQFLIDHPYCQHFLRQLGLTEKDVHEVVGRGPVCGIRDGFRFIEYRVPLSCEIHHMKGRGKFYLDTATWMAVGERAHKHIHRNTKESYEKGYMLPRR